MLYSSVHFKKTKINVCKGRQDSNTETKIELSKGRDACKQISTESPDPLEQCSLFVRHHSPANFGSTCLHIEHAVCCATKTGGRLQYSKALPTNCPHEAVHE